MTVLAFHNNEPKFLTGLNNFHPTRLRKLLSFLKYKSISILPLSEYLSLNDKTGSIAITFDDGYGSFYEYVRPIFLEMNLTATVFIPTQFIGGTNRWDYMGLFNPSKHLNKRQLKELNAEGFTIGSHGLNHEAFTEMGPRRLRLQLKQSKAELEEIIGKSVLYVSYPFGRFNINTIDTALECGYKRGFSLPGIGKKGHSFNVSRIAVYSYDTPWSIFHKIEAGPIKRLEKLKGAVMNQYAGGTIVLNRLKSINSRPD